MVIEHGLQVPSAGVGQSQRCRIGGVGEVFGRSQEIEELLAEQGTMHGQFVCTAACAFKNLDGFLRCGKPVEALRPARQGRCRLLGCRLAYLTIVF